MSLLTLTGPGGIGKTRLAIELAHTVSRSDRLSVHFVSLASVDRVQDAIPALAEAMGVWNSREVDPIARLARSISGQQTLLVLDNLEQIIDISPDIAVLLAECPGLTILATSREPLRIQGEREYSVPQLALPQAGDLPAMDLLSENESIALFVDRAQAVNQDFALEESNAPAVAQICARLDGLPLAIELAAARTKAIPPAALLSRLDSQLQILRSEARDLPVRLQTMRATIDWSYELLEPEEQRTFRRLSVFAGDFSLSGASAVLEIPEGAVVDAVTSLVDKSLVASRDPFDDEPFFRMLAVVREFGLERLAESGELDQVRLLHAEHIARVAEDAYIDQFRSNQGRVFQYLDRVHENVRLALGWTLEAEHYDLGIRIAAHLWQYWDVRGNLAEGRRWIGRLIERSDTRSPDLLPQLYYGYAILAGSREDANENMNLAERLMRIGESSGDRRATATARNIFGLSRSSEIALRESAAALELWQELGDDVWAGMSAGLASRWARENGDLDLAEEHARRSYELLKQSGHIWGMAMANLGVGRVLQLRGQAEQAASYLREGLELTSSIGDRIVVLRFFEYLFEIAAGWNQHERAVRLAACSNRMREVIGYGLRYPAEEETLNRVLDHAKSVLGEARFNAAWDTGLHLTLDEAIAEAIAIEPEPELDSGSPTESGFRLTRREREVLQRIVSGQTDQEIADELFVSYRTITTHVTNILNKLGASSRTEAAAIAVRDHLT